MGDDMESLEDVLDKSAERSPINYASAHEHRIDALLNSSANYSIKRQLIAVKFAINNKKITLCTGLSKLCYCLDEWEGRYL